MTRLRRYGVVLAAFLVLFGLTGCNAKGTGSNGAAAGSHLASLNENQFTSALVQAQARAGSAHVDATIKAAGQSAKLSADVSGFNNPSNAAVRMQLHSSQQTMELLLVKQALYVKGLPFGGSQAKPWLKVDLSKAGGQMSQLLTSANPAQYIAYLKGITKFQDRGLTTVDGVRTRHYTVTVDTAKMLKHNPAFKGQSMSGMGLPRQLTSDVYVDAQNRPVLLTLHMGSVASVSAHFSKYGEPVHISPPPANQVSTFSL